MVGHSASQRCCLNTSPRGCLASICSGHIPSPPSHIAPLLPFISSSASPYSPQTSPALLSPHSFPSPSCSPCLCPWPSSRNSLINSCTLQATTPRRVVTRSVPAELQGRRFRQPWSKFAFLPGQLFPSDVPCGLPDEALAEFLAEASTKSIDHQDKVGEKLSELNLPGLDPLAPRIPTAVNGKASDAPCPRAGDEDEEGDDDDDDDDDDGDDGDDDDDGDGDGHEEEAGDDDGDGDDGDDGGDDDADGEGGEEGGEEEGNGQEGEGDEEDGDEDVEEEGDGEDGDGDGENGDEEEQGDEGDDDGDEGDDDDEVDADDDDDDGDDGGDGDEDDDDDDDDEDAPAPKKARH
ncbi:unnamed protein product [Closterium sp. NIES-53]